MPKIGVISGPKLYHFRVSIIMPKFFAITLCLIVILPWVARAQTSISENAILENASTLLTRQQQRRDILEAVLKDVRGILENDLREIRMKVEQLKISSLTSVARRRRISLPCVIRWKS